MINKKILVAMSGGIDSSVAAILLKEQGYNVVGVTIKTGDYNDNSYIKNEALCCNLDSINEARNIAVKYAFPHYVVDLTSVFNKEIINDFINEYLKGRTPNPCVKCNPIIKSSSLLKVADSLNCDSIATGHYAKISYINDRYVISKAKDVNKDQSYVLWDLKQENIKRTIFPLGDLHKEEIRAIALEKGLINLINKKESYEICFIPDNNYRKFLCKKIDNLEHKYENGDFLDESGNVIGKHKGYPFYTIGQRRGLQIAVGDPLYVKKINSEKNTVTLAKRESLFSSKLLLTNYNFIFYDRIPFGKRVSTKIRYHDKGTFASIESYKEDKLIIKFEKPVFAISPGQSAVFYENDILIGGGIINDFDE